MGLKLSLVALILDAQMMSFDGYEMEDCVQIDGGVRVDLADETSRYFKDQEVELDASGQVSVEDIDGNNVDCCFSSKVAYIPSEKLMPKPAEVGDSSGMKVSLDGGVSFTAAKQGVRVIYEEVDVPGEDEKGQVHITLSEEGIVSDVWVTRDEPLDHNIGTSSKTIDEAVEAMVEEGA